MIQGQRWPISKLNSLVAVEQRVENCWRVRKYLGSMLTFDMGERRTEQGRRGPFEIGSSTIGVRQCFWRVEGANRAFDSDNAGGDTGAELTDVFKGLHLTGCERKGSIFILFFSNNIRLNLDLSNRYNADEDEFVASLSLKGGATFEMLPEGKWEMLAPQRERSSTARAA